MARKRIDISDLHDNAIERITETETDRILGGARRRTDPYGNFNFTVEIGGSAVLNDIGATQTITYTGLE